MTKHAVFFSNESAEAGAAWTPGLTEACSRTGIPVGVCQSLMPSFSSPLTHFLIPAKGVFTEAHDLWPNAFLFRTVNILHSWVTWRVRRLERRFEISVTEIYFCSTGDKMTVVRPNARVKEKTGSEPARGVRLVKGQIHLEHIYFIVHEKLFASPPPTI